MGLLLLVITEAAGKCVYFWENVFMFQQRPLLAVCFCSTCLSLTASKATQVPFLSLAVGEYHLSLPLMLPLSHTN